MILKYLSFLSLFFVVTTGTINADSWSAARGGPSRVGIRPGTAQLDQPQEVWAMPLGGALSSNAVWVMDDSEPAVIISAGGRISAKAWDDVTIWQSPLLQANEILAVIDVDQNGTSDTIVAHRNGVAGTLTLLNMDGSVRWIAPQDLGPLNSGIRIADLDDDGNLDLLTSPFKSGAGIHAFSLWPTTNAPTELWQASRSNRDYKAGFFDIIGEFDGSPGLEILSSGHHFLYLHDAATGVLEQTSPSMDVVPYSRATMVALDVDGNGIEEIFAFSNQGWAAPQNRRYVASYSWQNGTFSELWSTVLSDPTNDRLLFSNESVGDFDGNGTYEVAFSSYDSQSDSWSLEVRDATNGLLLANTPNEQFVGVVAFAGQNYIATQSKDDPLQFYQYTSSSTMELVYEAPNYELAKCRGQNPIVRSNPFLSACALTNGDLVLASRDSENRRTTIALVESLSFQPSITYTVESGSIVNYWIPPVADSPAIALATSAGKLLPLTTELLVPSPIIAVPYSWSGIFFGSAVQRTNFATFPLSFSNSSSPQGPENLLVIRGDKELVAISPATSASITGGVHQEWSQVGADRISLAPHPSGTNVLLFDQSAGVSAFSAITGVEQWNMSEIFSAPANKNLHQAPINVGNETWFHRLGSATYELIALANNTGAITIMNELETNNSGWRRLTSVTDDSDSPVVSSGPLGQVWTYDAAGNAENQFSTLTSSMIIDIDQAWLQISRNALERLDYDGTVVWETPIGNSQIKLGAVTNITGGQRYTTVTGNSNEVVSVDTTTGAVAWSVLLSEGALGDERTQGLVAFGNVTGIEELSSVIGTTLLVGGSDGYIYALSAMDGTLIWSLNLGAPVGEIITSDWDGDGFLELAVVTEDGKVRGIDSFTVPSPTNVIDIDPANLASSVDINRLVTEDELAAAWNTVEGATSYEVAVFSIAGDRIQNFVDVGAVTSTLLSGLPLVADTRYRVAVRAVFPDNERSVDSPSDGVTVLFEEDEIVDPQEPEPGEPTGGCGCRTGSSSSSGLTTLLLLVFSLAWIRRREARQE